MEKIENLGSKKRGYDQEEFNRIKYRLMTLHQERIETSLIHGEPIMLSVQEMQDLSEFMNTFLYD